MGFNDTELKENKKLKPDNPWICPNCGSKNVHFQPGKFSNRFECLDCLWDWE